MVEFVVGIVVGASAAALLMILVAPSRRVRAEPPLDRDVETRILLGMDPDRTIPPEPRPDEQPQYTATELAALQRLGQEESQRRKKR